MFHWMDALAQGSVGQAVLVICIVAAIGLGFGSIGLRSSPWNCRCLVRRNLLRPAWNAHRRTDPRVRPRFGLILLSIQSGFSENQFLRP